MSIRFETCERNKALLFLQKLYPDSDVSDGVLEVSEVLDLVEKDIFRIPDPDFHSGSIFPGRNMNDENKKISIERLYAMHDKLVCSQKETSDDN